MTTCSLCELHTESTFKVEGMDCRDEVALIERRFKHLPGLEAFTTDLMGQRLHVKYDAAKVSASAITAAVADAGMRAWLEHEEPLAIDDATERRRRIFLAISGAAFLAGLAGEFLHLPALAVRLAFAAAIGAGAPMTARKAWHAVRVRSLDINVLMLVAAAGAIALGQWSEGAAVVFLFAVAQALEARTLERARTAVRALMDLTPLNAIVRDGAGERSVAVDVIAPGAIIVVKPGEKVPLDGRIVGGASAVNQAPVTGESLPIDKNAGDEVFAGSINGHGALEVRVTRLRRDSTLARIIHLVERAQAERAPAQTFVERFAKVYTPAVIALAVVLGLVPPLLFAAEMAYMDLPCARAAGRVVPVRARHLDAGVCGRRARGRCQKGRAHQGRRASRARQPGAVRRVRQDRNAHARHAGGRGRGHAG